MLRSLVVLALTAAAAPAAAQDRRPSHCIAVAQAPGLEYVHRASYGDPLPDDWTIRLSYVDHSMFMLETAGGTRAVTDYNGYIGNVPLPDIVTMNRGHISHWSPDPQGGIAHVLPGWSDRPGEPVDHYVELDDAIVRSVSTDLRGRRAGGSATATPSSSSRSAVFASATWGTCTTSPTPNNTPPSAASTW